MREPGAAIAATLVMALACSFDSGGVGKNTESGDETTGSTGGASTGGPTTATGTDDGPTSAGTSETQGDTTTVDPPTSSTADATTGDASGSTGGDPDGPYVDCDENGLCPGGQLCLPLMVGETVAARVCVPMCVGVEECPDPPAGGAPELVCGAPEFQWCIITCDAGTCSDGMLCVDTEFGPQCGWAID